jgi:hypothetical protein
MSTCLFLPLWTFLLLDPIRALLEAWMEWSLSLTVPEKLTLSPFSRLILRKHASCHQLICILNTLTRLCYQRLLQLWLHLRILPGVTEYLGWLILEVWRCLGVAMKVGSTLTERQPTAVQSMKPVRKCASIPICGSRLLICVLVHDQWKQSYSSLFFLWQKYIPYSF